MIEHLLNGVLQLVKMFKTDENCKQGCENVWTRIFVTFLPIFLLFLP